VRIIIEIIQ